MLSVTRGQRVYFAAVGLLALWVGIWGYFIPMHVDAALPWLVPPLHARFLGAMYLSGAAFMVGCMLAQRWSEVRAVVPMIAIWTGMLFIVSLFYLNQFDFSRPQVWVWFGAYLVYPLIALALSWQHRAAPTTSFGIALPIWARIYLLALGSLTTVLAGALLLIPNAMVAIWPWKITPLLAQVYAAPFLSYGLGSVILALRRTWPEIRIAVTATLIFVIGVLLASIIHAQLFSAADTADWLWFGGLSAAVVGHCALTLIAHISERKLS